MIINVSNGWESSSLIQRWLPKKSVLNWDIKLPFKTTKTLLKLSKKCQIRNYLSYNDRVYSFHFLSLQNQNRCDKDIYVTAVYLLILVCET